MASNIFHGLLSIYQDIDLALTEHQVPPVVHVKQFDHRSRKVRCTLYQGSGGVPDPGWRGPHLLRYKAGRAAVPLHQ